MTLQNKGSENKGSENKGSENEGSENEGLENKLSENKDYKNRDEVLNGEGLKSIDDIEGFSFRVDETLKNNLNIITDINPEEQTIHLYSSNGDLIGYIKPGSYTYGNVSSDSHLEKKVFEEYMGKGYGQKLFKLYQENNFYIPISETHHKPSAILFDLRNGYRLTAKFDDNGNEVELSDTERIMLEDTLGDLVKNGDDDLDTIYRLER